MLGTSLVIDVYPVLLDVIRKLFEVPNCGGRIRFARCASEDEISTDKRANLAAQFINLIGLEADEKSALVSRGPSRNADRFP